MTNEERNLLLETARLVSGLGAVYEARLLSPIEAVEVAAFPEKAARIEVPLGAGSVGPARTSKTVADELNDALNWIVKADEPYALTSAHLAIERALGLIQTIRCDVVAKLEQL